MWTQAKRKNWAKLEVSADEAGGYLAPLNRPLVMDYDYRAMSKYASEKGLTGVELSEEERNMFKFDPPLVYD